MENELNKIGARTKIKKDNITIFPLDTFNKKPVFNTYNDHRMAMCLSLLSFLLNKITILNPNCVVKTFPEYFYKMEKVTQPPIITIDGPSASGKGTISGFSQRKQVLRKLTLVVFTEFYHYIFQRKR